MNEDKNPKKDDEINLKEAFLILVKRKWWFIGTVLLILAIGFAYVFVKPASFTLTYKIRVNENYYNKNLLELYPDYNKKINYILPINVPAIFKSEYGFESLDIKSEDGIDYNKFRKSKSVIISLDEDSSVFDISVSNHDYDLADKAAKTLIGAFDNSIKDNEKNILNEILGIIDLDIKNLEDKNANYENTIIADLETKIDGLYSELNQYIIDYNTGVTAELENNKKTENISFYNIIIPPNVISDKISKLQNEIDFLYVKIILENKYKIIDLKSLRESLLKDENIISARITLISEKPSKGIENNRQRDLVIVIALSLFAGPLVVFVVDFRAKQKKGNIAK
jgi:LPS O-antigen subunit length determinant protein (WzzB/FepE family)